ncbi:uncharacterized protein QC763_510950 [Podospora pseudopauciseta]|uniref:Uncharacterized protein n=1 Tax=Podospora pseudopauciseta TaxID=2093780 RepID=A0ABR0HAY2_9PEZI|nr:hypothetical protein QC763_510950 [Podospora pseudopauciseta]
MSTVTRSWQEQERLRLEKEKENERKRLEQERERLRIEQEKEAERKLVESERALKESIRLASVRAAASRTRTIPTSARTTQTTSSTSLQQPPSSTTYSLTPRPTVNAPQVATSRRLSVIPIDSNGPASSTPGSIACGQTGYFDCASEYGGGCCPVGFACSKGDLCVSPQLENEKPMAPLPCPGHNGYFACEEKIGGGCCPANYACIKDSRAQCHLSQSNLILTNVDRLATRIPIPTSSRRSESTCITGTLASVPHSEQQSPIGTPGDAAGIIVGGIMAIVAYFLGSYLLLIYRQRLHGSPLNKSFRVLEVRSQWRDARAKARSELPSHHGMSELAASRPTSSLPPLPSLPAAGPSLSVAVEVTRERQVDITHPLPPPPPLKLRQPLSTSPDTPMVTLPVSPPSATVPTLTPTGISPVSIKTMNIGTQHAPLSPPPRISLPPTPMQGNMHMLSVLEHTKMSGALGRAEDGKKQGMEGIDTGGVVLEVCADEQEKQEDSSSATADSSTIVWM